MSALLTGTIHSRALLDNHERLFTPGLFARIRLLDSTQRDAVLVNDSAIGTDQTVRYVLVVGTGNKVEYRPVQLGPVIDGLRVVQRRGDERVGRDDALRPVVVGVARVLLRVQPVLRVESRLERLVRLREGNRLDPGHEISMRPRAGRGDTRQR